MSMIPLARSTRHHAKSRAEGLQTGWTVVSYLIAGMIAYGGIGWLIGHLTHIRLLFPLGMLFGIALSLGYVIHRFGRQGAAGAQVRQGATGAQVKANSTPDSTAKGMTGDR